ncbi:hypothetical protein CDL12_27181 [Handroanthus impetiginosus]|uniref:Uncharacterized protein n=1 Tax=Handroanthus impetiginosus TaxID=429701 RepID=A0A2G9G4S4_9LAMI|nr:hypothetical protein CDL12_27181 [Handroanthus impetiginosus]
MLSPYISVQFASLISTTPISCALSLPKISTQLLHNGCGLPLNLEATGFISIDFVIFMYYIQTNSEFATIMFVAGSMLAPAPPLDPKMPNIKA